MQALMEWHRVLRVGGQLVIGAWEGSGAIDYGDTTDLVAIRHDAGELERMIRECGFSISRNVIELDEEMKMNAVYIECARD